MSRDWESVFSSWAQGPSKTEQEKIDNAERQIKEAIRNSEKLKARNIVVFTQGSYRNRVNVKRDSDVDIGVLCYDTYFPEYPDDNVKSELQKSFTPATYTYQVFKNEIEEALVARFGRVAVTRGNKAFDIKANSYRVEADVAAFFEHRRYRKDLSYLSGVELIPDNNRPPRVRNWPQQHYHNGVSKNDATARRYKRIIRIIKTLCNEMSDKGISAAFNIPGFLIECLVWNVPNDCFGYTNYKATVRSVLAFLFNNTMNDEQCNDWGEVSELKYLFRTSQPWTRQGAHGFISAAWDYVGFD
ncbi:nucleotidyltransferase [Paenibacillus sp. p3-SID867]|uniref:nucleotidyltransferase domain-containing protein n=1 Tax=Paenibacillus sp. p3-SID867 TaxID=2916363 RepID=UPI0021A71984|nr:nucleotidyltransferase [Paenibacillus sp. p3-SID867]MCT1399013.1 nucleotidyltransferase [Paenibacillus sp. p3-SID867]